MPEIVIETDKATVRRYTAAECRAERKKVLDSMGITLAEYRRLTKDACCVDCARPEWSEHWTPWADVDTWDFLLREGRHASQPTFLPIVRGA